MFAPQLVRGFLLESNRRLLRIKMRLQSAETCRNYNATHEVVYTLRALHSPSTPALFVLSCVLVFSLFSSFSWLFLASPLINFLSLSHLSYSLSSFCHLTSNFLSPIHPTYLPSFPLQLPPLFSTFPFLCLLSLLLVLLTIKLLIRSFLSLSDQSRLSV